MKNDSKFRSGKGGTGDKHSFDSSRHDGSIGRYDASLLGFFLCTVFFTIADLVTTSTALREGLSEANFLLLSISQTLGVGIVSLLTISKVTFIAGEALIFLLGVRSKNQQVKIAAFLFTAAFALTFSLVSLNNLLAIAA